MNKKDSKFLTSDKIFNFSMVLLVLAIPLLILFFWQESFYTDRTIAHEKFGTFGDFFGGVMGSIWALCGVILFYLALKEQRADFANNREALVKQIEALEVQTEEFKLQREELKESRKIFTEQAKTLKLQRFESTFFALIDLHRFYCVPENIFFHGHVLWHLFNGIAMFWIALHLKGLNAKNA